MKNAAGSNARGGHELKPAAVIPDEGVTRWLDTMQSVCQLRILRFPYAEQALTHATDMRGTRTRRTHALGWLKLFVHAH
jgi:hypothetical protein